jgi:hypothetical protein
LIVNSGMGQTTVEISDVPFIPGREYQAVIAQHGHVIMKSLEASLLCEEEATFTQGTDIRVESREVYRQPCLVRRDFRIEPALPFTAPCGIAVPPTAMHSFQSPHHVVRWSLVVRGEPESWPVFERRFPLVVYPGEVSMHREASKDGEGAFASPGAAVRTPPSAIAGAGA